MKKHISSLDSLRGICAIFIVLLHFYSYSATKIGTILFDLSLFFKRTYLAVDFFFILSGFVLSLSYYKVFHENMDLKSFASYIKKRFFRIYPLHLTTLLVLVISSYFIAPLFGPITADSFQVIKTPQTILTNLFLLQSSGITMKSCLVCTSWNYPSWSISVEWISYPLVPLFLYMFRSRLLIALGIVLSFALLFVLELRAGHLDVASYYGVLRCMSELFIGFSLFKLKDVAFKASAKYVYALISLIIITMHFNSFDTLVVFLIGLLLVAIINTKDKLVFDNRLTAYLGKISYSLYLVHALIQGLISFIYRYFFAHQIQQSTIFNQSALFMLYFVLVVFVSNYSYKYIECTLSSKFQKR